MLTDARVPEFWGGLGLPGLIDVHVHFYPERMLRKVWRYFDNTGRYGIDWPITYRWPDADRVAHLATLGVRAYPALSYAHRPGMAADLTAWALDFAAHTPGCLPSGTFFPEPGVLAGVDRALAAAARPAHRSGAARRGARAASPADRCRGASRCVGVRRVPRPGRAVRTGTP